MPNPSIPNGFKPTVQGYGIGDPGGVVLTNVAGGMPRTALQYDRSPQQFQVTMIMSPAKFSVWTAFYFRLIRKGALPFDMELDSGFGCQVHECRILPGSYSAVRVLTEHTSVSFVVLAVSKAYDYTTADAQNLVDLWNLYGDNTDDLFVLLERFANVDTRVLDFI